MSDEEHKHYKATIDESRYIVACANDPGKTMFFLHNGMGLTRIKLTDEAFLAMVNLFARIQRDIVVSVNQTAEDETA